VIGLVRRMLRPVLRPKPRLAEPQQASGPAQRLDAARKKLKETIPPRED
jgi:hypothetical protein